jgi:putative tryptophan/tyrosine transport system substrate-binding protein
VSASSVTMRSMTMGLAVGAVLLSPPLPGDSPPAVARIGVLLPQILASPAEAGLREGLRAQGYVEGQNIIVEWRRIGNSVEDAMPHAVELVRSKPDLILALSTALARAVMRTTSTIPIVFLSGDPIATGLTVSLARPSANATGVSAATPQLTAKRLDLLHQLIPHARRVAFLRNPSNAVLPAQFAEAQNAARQLGLHLETFDARGPDDLDAALRALQRSAPHAILVASDLGLLTEKAKITSAIRKARIPAVFPWREYHEDGALMSYGPDLKNTLRLTASYVARILKGAKPSDLPVEEISKFDLVIDLHVAHELNLKVPEELLFRADEVIR